MGILGDANNPRQATNRRIAAVGYVRVSTSEQAREGVSLDAQRGRIEAHCASRGIALSRIFADEGISGRRACNRPGLESAIAEVCATRGTLVVYSLSRLARSTKDAILIAERLAKAKAELVLLSESVDTATAAGRMFYAVLAALAAFESELIGERTKLALDHKRSKGERFSRHAPYGFRFNDKGVLVPNEREQAAVQAMRDLRREGLTLRAISVKLAKQGILNRAGKPFIPEWVGRFTNRPERRGG